MIEKLGYKVVVAVAPNHTRGRLSNSYRWVRIDDPAIRIRLRDRNRKNFSRLKEKIPNPPMTAKRAKNRKG